MSHKKDTLEVGIMGNDEALYFSRFPCHIPESVQKIAREETEAIKCLLRDMRTFVDVRLMGAPWTTSPAPEKKVLPIAILPRAILSRLCPKIGDGARQEIEVDLGQPIGFQLWVQVEPHHRLVEYHLGTAQKHSKGYELFVLNERPIQTSWVTVTLLLNKLGMWTLVRVSMGKIAPKGTRKNPVKIAFTLQMPHVRVRHKKSKPKQMRR